MFVLLYRVCIHEILIILATILCVYFCVTVELMYACKYWNSGNKYFCLCLCCCGGYAQMLNPKFWQWYFVFMFLLLYRLCTDIRLGILSSILHDSFCVVISSMSTCKTGNFGNDPSVYVWVYLQGEQNCKTGQFGNMPLCLCFCCCRWYLHIKDLAFYQRTFVLLFLCCCINYV